MICTVRKEFLRKTKKFLGTEFHCETLIKGMLIRCSGLFLNWTRERLKNMTHGTRKLISMHKSLQLRNNINSLYVTWKEGGKALTSIEDYLDAVIHRLREYINRSRERLITAAITTEKQQSQNLENKNEKKNICLDTSRDKRGKLRVRWPGDGYEAET